MAARDRSPAGAGLEAAGSQPIWFKKSTPHGALSRLTAFWHCSPICSAILRRSGYGSAMTTAREFVDFFLDVSVHADEQEGRRQDHAVVQHLADNLLNAARDQGFSKGADRSRAGRRPRGLHPRQH